MLRNRRWRGVRSGGQAHAESVTGARSVSLAHDGRAGEPDTAGTTVSYPLFGPALADFPVSGDAFDSGTNRRVTLPVGPDPAARDAADDPSYSPD
ncbi:hypothetical protein [Halostreptopolyspora alba]|uniref:Uncharacterized protein n=1 Tax=Halostreptopolyspora alba TaxID=2487137 RepID=A0A3N0E8T2_9ACTN|nr:hypothetical protein EFW17_13560 [Nocardiopsaceae bacterium YIM 96095]